MMLGRNTPEQARRPTRPPISKYAVRLRLKKQNKQTEYLEQQSLVSQTLRTENSKLKKNVDELSQIKAGKISMQELKQTLEQLSSLRSAKSEAQTQVSAALVRQTKLLLKSLYTQIYALSHLPLSEGLAEQSDFSGQNVLMKKQGGFAQSLESVSNTEVNESSQKMTTITKEPNKQQLRGAAQPPLKDGFPKKQREDASQSSPIYENSEEQCERLRKTNQEFKTEVSEMEHYIINLKQSLNNKQKLVERLTETNIKQAGEIRSLLDKLNQRQIQWGILQEEIQGYEHKIEQLEDQLAKLGQEQAREGLKISISESHLIGLMESPRQESLSQFSVFEQEGGRLGQSQKQIDPAKLEEIYDKTQKLLQKSKELEDRLKQKSSQHNKLEDILSKLGELLEVQQMPSFDSQAEDIVEAYTVTILGARQRQAEEYMRREQHLSTMVSKQLNTIIMYVLGSKQIASSNPNLQAELDMMTLFDKLQYLGECIKAVIEDDQDLLAQEQEKYFVNLSNIYAVIEQVGQHAGQIEEQMEENGAELQHICDGLDQQQDLGSIREYVLQLEQLLKHNQQQLQSAQSRQHQSSPKQTQRDLFDPSAIFDYLRELESVVKDIEGKSSTDPHQKCKRQREELLNQIKNLNEKHMDEANSAKVMGEFEEIGSRQSLQQQISRIKSRCAATNPDFIQELVNKMLEIRNACTQQALTSAIEAIFEQIRIKDQQNMKEQGRRKQIMRQRSAAIAQIVSKGIKDNSIEMVRAKISQSQEM